MEADCAALHRFFEHHKKEVKSLIKVEVLPTTISFSIFIQLLSYRIFPNFQEIFVITKYNLCVNFSNKKARHQKLMYKKLFCLEHFLIKMCCLPPVRNGGDKQLR